MMELPWTVLIYLKLPLEVSYKMDPCFKYVNFLPLIGMNILHFFKYSTWYSYNMHVSGMS